ncbi:MAG: AMP-binding protein, partial [Treponema sp.]|nr:AMP-binding protein [Treponema sp.]
MGLWNVFNVSRTSSRTFSEQATKTFSIVDSDGNELPEGVVGELYIGGRGVARGYNNLNEMTRERFVD